MNSSPRPQHLLGDIMQTLPAKHLSEIVKMRPPKYKRMAATAVEKARRQAEAEQAYHKQYLHLLLHADKVFSPSVLKRECLCHLGRLSNLAFSKMGIPKGQCPLEWNISGPVCKPFSLMGVRRLLSDQATDPWQIWLGMTALSDMDLTTCENSDRMPKRISQKGLDDFAPNRWLLISLKQDSSRTGWPYHRHRRWRTALNMNTMIWLGSNTTADDDVQRHFDSLFNAHSDLDGDAFLDLDDDDAVEEEVVRRSLAAVQGNFARGTTAIYTNDVSFLMYSRAVCCAYRFRVCPLPAREGDKMIYIYIYIYMYMCVYIYIYMCASIYIYIYIYIRVYIYIYVCIYIYM